MPAGPTIEAFHDCNKFVKGIMGAFASAKSVACCWDIFFNAMIQPKQKDGKRRSRYAVARSTYRELDDATIRTWKDWMGAFGSFKVGSNSFMMEYGDIEAEILFRALDRPEDVDKLLSVEYTKAWLNEARDFPKAIFDALTGRVGRYPSEAQGEALLAFEKHLRQLTGFDVRVFKDKMQDDSKLRIRMTPDERSRL